MRCHIRWAGVAVSVFLLLLPLLGAADDAAPSDFDAKQITLGEYRQELSRIDRQLKALVEHPEEATALRQSIPPQWEVKASSGSFYIDNQELQHKLDRYADTPADRGEVLPELEFRIEAQLEGAEAFEHPADATARDKLETILQGREYRKLSRTQSPLEILKDRVLNWAIRLLSGLFRIAGAHPRVSLIFLWTTIGSVILGFIVWLYLLLRRSRREEYFYPRDDGRLFPSSKPWQQWLRESHSAAERGDWRDAVHLAYWCSISYLESTGVWKPDRARTPREYLRSFKPQTGAAGRREPLEALTRRFESVWYAQHAASSEDFQFSLAQLEKIGCR